MSFNFFSLDYIYYPVSGIMWVWHKVFGSVLGADNAWAWVLSVVFLVFTLRSLLFKPFMNQMNSQFKMQAVAPELKKLREKYKGDRTRLAEEMQKFNKEAGVNPLGGCLPALIQAPVFIGLFHVLKMFRPGQNENYFFGASDVTSFVDAKLFGGAPLSAFMTMPLNTKGGQIGLAQLEGIRSTVVAVGIPLTILAGIATYLTSRRSVARQEQMQGDNEAMPQAAIMNKLMKYVFPLFVVIGGPFFPLAILFYWLSNNTWTFGQLYVAHRIQDRKLAEESMVVNEAKEAVRFTKPAPGSRPAAGGKPAPGLKPLSGAKPVTGTRPAQGARPAPGARPAVGVRPVNGTKSSPGARPASGTKRPVTQPSTKPGVADADGSTNGSATRPVAGSRNGSPSGAGPSLEKTTFSPNASSPTSSGSTPVKPQAGTRGTTAKKKKPGPR